MPQEEPKTIDVEYHLVDSDGATTKSKPIQRNRKILLYFLFLVFLLIVWMIERKK
jgi:hypothetical protein